MALSWIGSRLSCCVLALVVLVLASWAPATASGDMPPLPGASFREHYPRPDCQSRKLCLLAAEPVSNIALTLRGQGLVVATIAADALARASGYTFFLRTDNSETVYTIDIAAAETGTITIRDASDAVLNTTSLIELHERHPWIPTDLVNFPMTQLQLWISIDKKNGYVRVGFGYPLLVNEMITIGPIPKCLESSDANACAIGTVTEVDCSLAAVAYSVTRFPVVAPIPPLLVDRHRVTLEVLEDRSALVPAVLPLELQSLYDQVAGEQILLSESDAAAIDLCIKTEGCVLYEKLQEKINAGEMSDDPHMAYIRVTIGPDLGNSPGSPFVMEIWPPKMYSPIHDHANAVAVIKCLSGTITSRWYNPLAEQHNGEPVPFAEGRVAKGQITYLTPAFFQTHKLANEEDVTCVTIQSYYYLHDDYVHNETFHFTLPTPDDNLHVFKPGSDFEYSELIQAVRQFASTAGANQVPPVDTLVGVCATMANVEDGSGSAAPGGHEDLFPLPEGKSREYVDTDGVTMEWDGDKGAYFPKVDAAVVSNYQAQYPTTNAGTVACTGPVPRACVRNSAHGQPGPAMLTLPRLFLADRPASKWQVHAMPDGRPYYFNTETQTSVWVMPPELVEAAQVQWYWWSATTPADEDGSRRLDPGAQKPEAFTAMKDERGNAYYFNKITRQSQWERPAGFQEATAAAVAQQEEKRTAVVERRKQRKQSKEEAARAKVQVDGNQVKLKDTVNCHVYVTGLPLVGAPSTVPLGVRACSHVCCHARVKDITLEEFTAFMRKAGIINEDAHGEPKIKLYTDEHGEPKGDGKCTYLRVESVELALQLLDETEIRPGFKVKIQRAVFQLREGMTLGKKNDEDEVEEGSLEPAKKKAKKKSLGQKYARVAAVHVSSLLGDTDSTDLGEQDICASFLTLYAVTAPVLRKLHWHETDTKRKRAVGVLVLKHMFTLEEMKEDASYIFELKDTVVLMRRCGMQNNPDGVVMVRYFTDEPLGPAIATLNGRFFAGQKVVAEEWDGKTKYKVEESEEEKEARIKQWDEYLRSQELEEAAERKARAAADAST
ncbi:uncharacterized protein MONBRDRAFT_35744 [Monosiga brevicollis MX1]|uniref:WW domain-containing protein n=1 Tax=Monosiga brevicollis TaxID=81824 RepID=A9UNJ8_MONBE|nr:uncharacterized protein MONBRDRAFT_35744 [Monosiga brevicollis MX1]EDQ92707.1 predicted protein [Monosiga brevicollis MX1]|eukprot:XP_001742469.1 hypothetical protein [Monosiga brevicollis MX1]